MGLIGTGFSLLKDFTKTRLKGPEDEEQKKKKGLLARTDEIKGLKKILGYIRNFSNPAVIIFVIIGIVIFVLISGGGGGASLGGLGDDEKSSQNPPGSAVPSIPGFNINIEGPVEKANGELLEYTVTVSHDPSVAPPISTIELFDTMPSNATFVSTTGTTVGGSDNLHIWPLSKPENQTSFSVILKPAQDDTYVSYTISARITSTGGGAPPSLEACSGRYDLASTPLGTNFGDPECNFTKDDLYLLLKSLDPASADKWYYQIVPCESQYYPLAYNGAAVDSAGAWGLFQMGRGKNGQYDHGDVAWQTQASNAVNYNALINNGFAYWACAR